MEFDFRGAKVVVAAEMTTGYGYLCKSFTSTGFSMRRFVIFLLFASLFFSCKNQPKTSIEPEQIVETTVQLPQDFVDFYERFHKDSLYQMEHIVWPLQGDASEQIDSTHYQKKKTQWQPESWHMQRLDYNPNDYNRNVQMLGEVVVIERIWAKAANYGIERRFSKQAGGDWALIYYSDLQEMQ